MEKYIVITSKVAKRDLAELYKSGNQALIKRIERIFKELSQHPEKGIGKPERLKYKLTGQWSRRIDDKNRLIYEIKEERITVLVISAKGHYSDK